MPALNRFKAFGLHNRGGSGFSLIVFKFSKALTAASLSLDLP